MFPIITVIASSLSLGLYCLAACFYLDLYLGYEFVVIGVSLQIASILIAIAMSEVRDRLKVKTLILILQGSLIISSYLLLSVNFVNLAAYFVALLCLVVPVVLLGMFIAINGKEISTKVTLLSIVVGLSVSVVVVSQILEWKGLWMVFLLSALTFTLSVLLMKTIPVSVKVLVLGLFAGGFFFVGKTSSDGQLVGWALSDKPVTIPSLSPFPENEDANFSWWQKNYPLMILPFELKKPSKVMTISSSKGPDANIAKKLYGAEMLSIYDSCASFNDSDSCDRTAISHKLEKVTGLASDFDLISFSMPYQFVKPDIGVSAAQESIHTIEFFHEIFDKLGEDGVLAVNARDPVMLHKALSYVWRVLSEGSNDKIIKFERNIRVLQLASYASNRDAYNYLVLVSKRGFSEEQLQEINGLIRSAPVFKVIYDSLNNVPPYIFFKQLDKIRVSDAVLHLTRASSWKYKQLINLEPSSIIKPNYFHLSNVLHPFVSGLSALFLLLGLYGLLISQRLQRNWKVCRKQSSPVLSILLFQSSISIAAFSLILYVMTSFSAASLGYSSTNISFLMVMALAAFSSPYALIKYSSLTSKGFSGLWFYPAVLLSIALLFIGMAQDVAVLFGMPAKAVIFILTVMMSFCFGLVHQQANTILRKLYPATWFWFWYMAAIAVVLAVILSQYLFIQHDFNFVVRAAIGMIVFTAFVAWWSLDAIKSNDSEPG